MLETHNKLEKFNDYDLSSASIDNVQAVYANVMNQLLRCLNVPVDPSQEFKPDWVVAIGDVPVGFRLNSAHRLIDIYIGLDLPFSMPLNEAYLHLLKRQSHLNTPFQQVYCVNPENDSMVMHTYVSLDEVDSLPEEFLLHVKILVANSAVVWN